jgi:hypothetical protein
MNVTAAEVSEDRRSVLLRVDDLKPVDQVHIVLKVINESGDAFEEEIYWTINAVPADDDSK